MAMKTMLFNYDKLEKRFNAPHGAVSWAGVKRTIASGMCTNFTYVAKAMVSRSTLSSCGLVNTGETCIHTS
jgi:hypothetical protein